jgi:hypothetical protein
LTDLPPCAPTVINKIINDCIVLFLRHVQRLYHFSKIQLSTANLMRTRLFGPLNCKKGAHYIQEYTVKSRPVGTVRIKVGGFELRV